VCTIQKGDGPSAGTSEAVRWLEGEKLEDYNNPSDGWKELMK
jgi:hypothetical protein